MATSKSEKVNSKDPIKKSNHSIRLATWNVNGIRACYEKNLPQFIMDKHPDILCLQETKAHIDQVEPHVQKLTYKNAFWSSAYRKGYSGVATFLNSMPLAVNKGFDIPKYDTEGRIVWTRHENFDLYNIYFPNGGSGEERHQYKQEFLKDLRIHLDFEIKRGREIILVGDYNVAHKPIDVYDPVGLSTVSGFLPEEQKWFGEFLESGFVDCFRYLHPDTEDMYSWWSYKDMARKKNNGWRIDYICVTPGLLPALKSCDILMAQEGSDHCPVMADFQF